MGKEIRIKGRMEAFAILGADGYLYEPRSLRHECESLLYQFSRAARVVPVRVLTDKAARKAGGKKKPAKPKQKPKPKQSANPKKYRCPDCGTMTDGDSAHETSRGGECLSVLGRRGWRTLGVYDG